MKDDRLALLALALSAALPAWPVFAQLPPRQPTPTIPMGPRDPVPPRPGGAPPIPDPCAIPSNQPVLKLSVSPQRIYREDRITVRWEVFNPKWPHAVQIEAPYADPAFPPSVPLTGTHTFSTITSSGHVTLKTFCGEKRVSWERIPDAILDTVTPERGAAASEVTLAGHQFGNDPFEGRVEMSIGGQTQELTVTHWDDTRVRATVPNVAAGQAQIRLVKGGHRPTLWRPFRVVKSLSINSAGAALALATLGIQPGFIHLDAGQNASSITLPAGLNAALGIPATFTMVSVDLNVPRGEKIAQTVLLPLSGFPEMARYQVHDVNSNGLSASVAGGQLVLTLTFESAGPEVKGRVRYCDVGAFGACVTSSWKDNLAPDIQIDNVRVTLRLTPAAANGALVFPSGQGTIEADVQIGNDFANWIVPGLRAYTNDIKNDVLARVTARLNAQATRDALATAFMGRLRALDPGFQSVVAVTPNGNSILVEYQ